MKCPVCDKPVKLGEQVQEWDKDYGNDVVLSADFPAFLNIFCEYCGKPVISIFIESQGYELPEEVQEKIQKDREEREKEEKRNER